MLPPAGMPVAGSPVADASVAGASVAGASVAGPSPAGPFSGLPPLLAPEPLYLRRPDAREPGPPKRVTP
jgi:hypothetical protein